MLLLSLWSSQRILSVIHVDGCVVAGFPSLYSADEIPHDDFAQLVEFYGWGKRISCLKQMRSYNLAMSTHTSTLCECFVHVFPRVCMVMLGLLCWRCNLMLARMQGKRDWVYFSNVHTLTTCWPPSQRGTTLALCPVNQRNRVDSFRIYTHLCLSVNWTQCLICGER